MSFTQAQDSPQAIRRHYHHRLEAWRETGLSARAAGALALAGCDTQEDITRLGRGYFVRLSNCAAKTLAELEALAAWPAKPLTAVETITAALLLSINDHDEAREAATDALIALRRSGFVVVATRSAPAGSR